MLRALPLLLILASLRLSGATVQGRIEIESAWLPGCTVRLQSEAETLTAVSDHRGRYRFEDVASGEYDVSFDLPGLVGEEQRVLVRGDLVTVPDQQMRLAEGAERVVLACPDCSDVPPASRFDYPLCSEQRANDAWITLAHNGDRSAIQLLERRYAHAETYRERHRIAGALLRRIANDSAIWNELASEAEIAVRFPETQAEKSPEYLAWCETQNADPDELSRQTLSALHVTAEDPRSHALLLRALATDDSHLVGTAIYGLAVQRDFASLPLIRSAIERLPDHRNFLVTVLAYYRDERADALARFYLDDEQFEDYREQAPR